jgi:flavin reductase (DIM6/NTAB) family NADH-FMN oxidoreductase RutF
MSGDPTLALDPAVRKKVLRMIPYGLFVVTSRHDGEAGAATIDWVTQASFDPPMVVVCLRADSYIYELVRGSGRYALHPLGAGQKDFAAAFFKHASADDATINGHAYTLGRTGVPILDAAPASIELELVDVLTQSDHHVLLGRVTAVELKRETEPLLLKQTGWNYGG